MITLKVQPGIFIIIARLLVVALLPVVVQPVALAYADLPVRPQPGLPERPVVHVLPSPAEDTEISNTRIILHVDRWDESLWGVVQWQGMDGSWHDVEGWQGHFNQQGQIRWWVAPKDFNTGPFRWIIYDANRIDILWISTPFDLPHSGESLVFIASH